VQPAAQGHAWRDPREERREAGLLRGESTDDDRTRPGGALHEKPVRKAAARNPTSREPIHGSDAKTSARRTRQRRPNLLGRRNGMKTHTESGGARLSEMKTERTTGSNGARFEKKTVADGVLHRELRRSRRVFGTWPWRRILGETRLTLAHN
jgi:hypothetical protein